jgi:hypothetical protein
MRIFFILSALLFIFSAVSCSKNKNPQSVEIPSEIAEDKEMPSEEVLSEDTEDVILWDQTEIASPKETLNFEDIYGEYTLVKFAPHFSDTDQRETMEEALAWLYRCGYDTINISQKRITFGNDIVNNPDFDILEKELEVFKDADFDQDYYEYTIDRSEKNDDSSDAVPGITVKKSKLKIRSSVESGVIIYGARILYYNCSETAFVFPDLERKYGVVINPWVPTLVYGIEPIDGNHIITYMPYVNIFLLYRKDGAL